MKKNKFDERLRKATKDFNKLQNEIKPFLKKTRSVEANEESGWQKTENYLLN